MDNLEILDCGMCIFQLLDSGLSLVMKNPQDILPCSKSSLSLYYELLPVVCTPFLTWETKQLNYKYQCQNKLLHYIQ